MNSQKPKEKSIIYDKNSNYKSKRRSQVIIGVLFGSIIGVVLLCLAVVGAISRYNQPKNNSNGTLIFHEADYSYDIMSDPNYLDLDRNVYFSNPENGMTSALEDGNLDSVPMIQREYVSVLCNFIQYAIHGQTQELNSLFSQEYIEADGKLKMDFTMQQLYNIKITYIESSSVEVDGVTHVSYDYWLEYMIRKNNGTFRNDMESDCIRKEYVRVTNRDGVLGIDVLAPYTTAVANNSIIKIDKIIILSAVSVTLITFVTVICCTLIRKKCK